MFRSTKVDPNLRCWSNSKTRVHSFQARVERNLGGGRTMKPVTMKPVTFMIASSALMGFVTGWICGNPTASSNVHQSQGDAEIALSRTVAGFWSLSQPIMPVDVLGFLDIPEKYTHIKLDIGLSVNAPNSALWLDKLRLPGRFVIGIEPNAKSLQRLESGLNNLPNEEAVCPQKICDSSDPLYKILREKNAPDYWALNAASHVGKDWYGVRAAVDDGQPRFQDIYIAGPGLQGTDSLLNAKAGVGLNMIAKTAVPIIRLSDIFDRIDFDRFQFVEHLKIDAQGMDGRILRSAKHYLKERVVYVTIELSAEQYIGAGEVNVDDYLRSQGFEHLGGESYVNARLKASLDPLVFDSLDGSDAKT